jgi:hypothetical protein
VQHTSGRRRFLAQESEQQVLGADVVVKQTIGFFGGKAQNVLCRAAERDVRRPIRGTALFELAANHVAREFRLGEDPAREPLALAEQPEEDMLRLNRDGTRLTGFIARKEQHSPRTLGVPLEHIASPQPPRPTAFSSVVPFLPFPPT